MNYVYLKTLPEGLWTVGFYDPKGNWHPESDHDTAKDAAERVVYLNGGSRKAAPADKPTLRDYFAARAMEGYIVGWAGEVHLNYEDIAQVAYAVAEAMLAEREKDGKEDNHEH
jgi:hypothetical protein